MSHLVKNEGEAGHLPVDTANFKVIGCGYRNNSRRRKPSEALLAKKLKPTLNIQKKSVSLKRFNWTPFHHNVMSFGANIH